MIRRYNPSEACTKLHAFANRVERLLANQYTLPRLRTVDLNKLKEDLRKLHRWLEIADNHKNPNAPAEAKARALEAKNKMHLI